MKKISYSAYENSVLLSHPNARIEVRDGVEVVVIPTWDFNTDESGEHLYELVRDGGERAPKFQPGDTLRHTETGTPFDVVDPVAKLMSQSLRKGPNVKDDDA